MVSIVRLRFINLAGCVFFIVYGALIGAIPIILTNTFITVVNIVQLIRTYRSSRQSASYERVGSERWVQAREYWLAHQADIQRFHPYATVSLIDAVSPQNNKDFLLGSALVAVHESRIRGLALWRDLSSLRPEDLEPYAGLREAVMVWRGLKAPHDVVLPPLAPVQGPAMILLLDYIDARYRDLGLGQKLFEHLELEARTRWGAELEGGAITVLAVCDPSVGATRRYLKSLGFETGALVGGLCLQQRSLPISTRQDTSRLTESLSSAAG